METLIGAQSNEGRRERSLWVGNHSGQGLGRGWLLAVARVSNVDRSRPHFLPLYSVWDALAHDG